jgi:hypothetical protein
MNVSRPPPGTTTSKTNTQDFWSFGEYLIGLSHYAFEDCRWLDEAPRNPPYLSHKKENTFAFLIPSGFT